MSNNGEKRNRTRIYKLCYQAHVAALVRRRSEVVYQIGALTSSYHLSFISDIIITKKFSK